MVTDNATFDQLNAFLFKSFLRYHVKIAETMKSRLM